ncbi:hypothetical protein J6590_015709 [Homalodisca vitripennis]|nr:hypothetical protein J6590_015709 [Homalodisca vitripennis]
MIVSSSSRYAVDVLTRSVAAQSAQRGGFKVRSWSSHGEEDSRLDPGLRSEEDLRLDPGLRSEEDLRLDPGLRSEEDLRLGPGLRSEEDLRLDPSLRRGMRIQGEILVYAARRI